MLVLCNTVNMLNPVAEPSEPEGEACDAAEPEPHQGTTEEDNAARKSKKGKSKAAKVSKEGKLDAPDNSGRKLKYSSAGKIQLVALGLCLKQCGVELWNL